MVVKRCPDCDQTLPVACKSCTCGHVFVSRKQQQQQQQLQQQQEKSSLTSVSAEGDSSSNDSCRDKRLRQERAKKEIPDFDYDYSLVTAALSDPVPMKSVKGSGPLREPEWFDQAVKVGQPGLDIINMKRKRGRPKGSKNKPKTGLLPGKPNQDQSAAAQDGPKWDESGHPILVKKKRGRPKGSKNKPKEGSLAKNNACAGEVSDDDSDRPGGAARLPIIDVMPRISKEKAAMYSIILSDINQKMLSQSSMNLMLS